VRTLLVSDLHLGALSCTDLLRRPEPRAALLAELRDVERLVLLGDTLELRHGPHRDALTAARPFFEDLGRALDGREIVVVAGNHDHALAERWLRERDEQPTPAPLGLEQRFAASEGSAMLATLEQWARPARLSGAYPGLWLRPDVYATHGHFLDCHLTVPTIERLGIALTAKALRRPADSFASVEDYEAVTAPVFAWIDAVARQTPTGKMLNGQSSLRVWQALNGGRRRRRLSRRGPSFSDVRTHALTLGFPLAVAAINRTGIGAFHTDISSRELHRAGLEAMGETTGRLGLGDGVNVIFGHTHRRGPLEGDRQGDWRGQMGARLFNTGCWTYDSFFLTPTPGESPYWPGGAVLVDDQGPPLLKRLLDDRTHAQLTRVPA
jgi:predicted phosphodiesterase